MKKLSVFMLILWVGILTSEYALGEGYIFEINTNKTVIEGRFGLEWDFLPNFISFGAGILYNEDDFTIYNADIGFGSTWIDHLKVSMGFKGIFGTYRYFPEDADLGAVGFLITGDYDFGFSDYGFPFDISISGRVCIAPDPLSFNDTDKYSEFETMLNFHILQQRAGSVQIGYRYISMSFDKRLNIQDESDSAAFIGYRLRF